MATCKRSFPFSLRNSKAKEVTEYSDSIEVPTPEWDVYKTAWANGTGMYYVKDGVHLVRRPLAEVVQALVKESNLRYEPNKTVLGGYKLKAGE